MSHEPQNNSPATKDIQALIDELDIKGAALSREAWKSMRRLENSIQVAKHREKVTSHALEKDMLNGLNKILKASEGIELN